MDTSSISSSKLTGADRQAVLGYGSAANLVGLCVDVNQRRLYWSDRLDNRISTSDYNGNNIRHFRLPQSYAGHVISLSVGQVGNADKYQQ